ncbi:vWA domain-containing protein [Paenibacillus massiliensis]|uniref:vWA domain-containing protein n=1 Tax=Paenibacillus massiliensis TaxID=225917 RepID=UPI000427B47A|nr:VWA domain-containing protein [Paenibacillus massiliensis]
MKKRFVTILLFFYFFSGSMILWPQETHADTVSSGYDAVFVLDTSYSMRETDHDEIASEVINMFMDMSDADRTRVGFVAYNHRIVASRPLTSIAVTSRKNQLQQEIATLNRSGYTDIGLGLKKGAELLVSGTQNGRQPFLILLSDGETDFGPSSGPRTKAASAKDVSSVIDSAQRNQYPIYTIGLNHTGTVNREELERIATETGGKSFITSSADDLPEIFNHIFADQIRSKLVPIAGITATGALQEITVNIPDSSMEEANLILLSEHPVGEAQLYASSDNIRRYLSDRYTILKIERPKPGQLSLKVRGQRGDLIKINLLGNYLLEANAYVKSTGTNVTGTSGNSDKELLKGAPTTFSLDILNQEGQRLEDEALYKAAQAELIITNTTASDAAPTSERIPMTLTNEGFSVDYTFPRSGEYTWQIQLDSPQLYRHSTIHQVTAVNTAPVAADQLNASVTTQDGLARVELSEYFQDANQDSLTYTLAASGESSSLKPSISGTALLLAATGRDRIEITATDTEGAATTAVLQLHVKSEYATIQLISIIAALAAAAAVALYIFLRPKPQFAGRLEGYFLTTASGIEIPVKSWPLTSFPGRTVTLQELFRLLDVHEPLPEAARITFTAGKDGSLIFKHDTRCAVQHGKALIARNKKLVLLYNDKLYITFEDGATEIELRYKAIKPNTNVYTDGILIQTG